jgi:hypothetical protein
MKLAYMSDHTRHVGLALAEGTKNIERIGLNQLKIDYLSQRFRAVIVITMFIFVPGIFVSVGQTISLSHAR